MVRAAVSNAVKIVSLPNIVTGFQDIVTEDVDLNGWETRVIRIRIKLKQCLERIINTYELISYYLENVKKGM